MTPEKIKELRLALGYTQAGLAEKLGTTATTINRWERGKSKPSPVWCRELEQLDKNNSAWRSNNV